MYLLSERGFRGQLQANHKEKKLDLQVSIHAHLARLSAVLTYRTGRTRRDFEAEQRTQNYDTLWRREVFLDDLFVALS